MDNLTNFKGRLNLAFKAMRKAGLIARQNFSCCCGCAGYELATAVTDMSADRRAKVKGCAFYTKQAAARIMDRGAEVRGVTIPYGPLDTQEHGQVGLDTLAVGQIVATCLRDAGLLVEWDGTAERTIFVTLR